MNCSSSQYYSVKFPCELDIKYVVDNKEYKETIKTKGSHYYTTGETIDILYDIKNPTNVNALYSSYGFNSSNYKTYGILLLIIGIIWLFGGYSIFSHKKNN